MTIESMISIDAAAHFVRTPADWEAALNACEGDRDAVYGLVLDFNLDPELKSYARDPLMKLAAKLLGCTVAGLKADVGSDIPSAKDDRKDDLDYAREVLAEFGDGNLIHAPGGFWAWRDRGLWQPIDLQEVRQAVQRVLEGQTRITANAVESVTRVATTTCFKAGANFDEPAADRINVLNGTLERQGSAWLLRESRREDYLTAQVPVPYEPDAACPRFMQYLDEVFEPDRDRADKIRVVLELIGYSLLQACPFPVFLMLVGGGANGKSVLLEVLLYLVGREQAAAQPLARLGDRFVNASLRGKLINLVPEMSVGESLRDGPLKQFTAGDLVSGEFKGRDGFEFKPYATLWTATNTMPHTRDLSDGMARRTIVIPFNRKFSESERDASLTAKLLKELPGIMVAALQALLGVYERGGFTRPASSQAALAEWFKDSDQVAQFVEAECKVGPGYGPTLHQTLFQAYLVWGASQNMQKLMSGKGFSERLVKLGAVSTGGKVRCEGARGVGFYGIDLL
ncbi:MAG: phage/plasmid primase, P4 family [Azovibrio sp.]|uniref:DNA primase family protein n=1 Tax=Azovibrio sp. TaxID=1872673 RepID=UPI003C779AAF